MSEIQVVKLETNFDENQYSLSKNFSYQHKMAIVTYTNVHESRSSDYRQPQVGAGDSKMAYQSLQWQYDSKQAIHH